MNYLNKAIVFLGCGLFLMLITVSITSQFHENQIPPSNTALFISTFPILGSTSGLIGLVYLYKDNKQELIDSLEGCYKAVIDSLKRCKKPKNGDVK